MQLHMEARNIRLFFKTTERFNKIISCFSFPRLFLHHQSQRTRLSWQMHRPLGMWLWEGVGRHEQARVGKVAESGYHSTTRLPSDLQEINKSDPPVWGLGEWRGPGAEDVASEAQNSTPQDVKPGAGVRRDRSPFQERAGGEQRPPPQAAPRGPQGREPAQAPGPRTSRNTGQEQGRFPPAPGAKPEDKKKARKEEADEKGPQFRRPYLSW